MPTRNTTETPGGTTETSLIMALAQLEILGEYLWKRDWIIREAYRCGIRKMDIHRATGLTRRTIDAILKKG